jgi:hypothetical protein
LKTYNRNIDLIKGKGCGVARMMVSEQTKQRLLKADIGI